MKLHYKISLWLLLPLLLLSLSLLLIGHLDLQRRFVQHAQQTEQARITPMLELLSLNYQQQQGWSFLHPAQGRNRLPRHVRIEDEQGQWLYGQSGPVPEHWQWFAIDVAGERVGRLGLPRQNQLLLEADQLFASQMQRQLLWLLLSVLVIVPLLAWVLAALLSRPLARVRHTVSQLNQGQYQVPLNLRGQDELGQLARDLQQLGHSLASNQTARQQWLADIAHELRTPLAVLQADLEAMQDGIRPVDQQAVTRLQQQSQRLNNLVNDLAQLARSDQVHQHYHLQPLPLAAHLQQWFASQQTADIELDIALESVTLFADPQRLAQLWLNLLSNSRKYSQTPLRLRVSGRRTPEGYRLLWQDSSPCVAAEHLPKLFDRLYRVYPEQPDLAPPGHGLGLAICQQIVARHQGSIVAQPSELGGLAIAMDWPLGVIS